MSHLLYHCFSRSRNREIEAALKVLQGIIESGLFLVREDPQVRWKDPCGSLKSIEVRQYRFCLTSLNNNGDLRDHCRVFGPIGIGFKTEFIRSLGGFPVFYLPAPMGKDEGDTEDRLGVSLVYRLAELRLVTERIKNLPQKYRSFLYRDLPDVDEMEGAIRFLGNILYFTDYTRQTDTVALRYYRQREWRVIAGLTTDQVRVELDGGNSYYVLSEYNNIPIYRFISDIVVYASKDELNLVNDMLASNGVPIRARRV